MPRRFAFHPLVLAAFPVLFLWSENRHEVLFGHVIGPLTLVLGATLACFAVATLLLRDHRRGALIASGLSCLALSYGHVLEVLPQTLARPRPLLAVWGLLAVIVVVAAVRTQPRLADLTGALNVAGAALLVIAVAPLAPRMLTFGGSEPPRSSAAGELPDVRDDPAGGRDIFYIVPDRYPSARNLEELFGADNDDLLGDLEGRGFAIADDSITNYNKTAHALAAALNLEYLDDVADRVRRSGRDQGDWQPLHDLLYDHEVGRFLTANGYRHIHLGMWWEPTRDAATADVTYNYGQTTEFGSVFERTTPWPTIRHLLGLAPEDRDHRGAVRETTLFQLRKLEEVAERDPTHPRFVFAHLNLPHEPYVFDADGAWISEEEQERRSLGENFLGQLAYTNDRLRGIVDRLLEGPEDEHPIIVIQADEALHPLRYRLDEDPFVWPEATDAELLQKFRILTAMYLPGIDDGVVPEDITPVNTFRLIFDRYLGTDHGLLPDRAFVIHDHRRLYDLTEVTDRIRDADPIPPGFDP